MRFGASDPKPTPSSGRCENLTQGVDPANTGTTRRPSPTSPKGSDRAKHQAERLQKWRPAASDSEDLKEEPKPKAATARASRRPSAQKL